MTPQIALDLSLDGITVLSRAPSGGWWREGTVRLDMPDMPERLARLRDTVETRVGADFTSILILPDSQLLYTSLERDDRKADETIRSLLKGRTPYPVEDLTFDHVEQGDRLQVAVVALETLLEAETFAAEYGFRPVALVANPQNPAYPGIPNFGKTGLADDLLRGTPLSLDLSGGFNAVTAPPLPAPAVPKAPTVETAPEAEAPAPAADHHPEFTSPRRAEAAASAPVTALPDEDAPAAAVKPEAADTPSPEADTGAGPTGETPAPEAPPAIKFTSSRAAAAKTDPPEARAASGERLAKVAPRLTPTPQIPKRAAPTPVIPAPSTASPPPAPSADGPLAAPSKPKRPAGAPKLKAPAGKAPRVSADKAIPAKIAKAAAPAPSAATPTAKTKPESSDPGAVPAGALGTMAMRLKARNAAAKDAKVADQAAAERLVEAQSLALPGLARERAAIAPKSTARLGLYLTVGLLAVLIAIGAGSVLLGPEETVDETPDDVTTSQLSLAPNPAAAPVPDDETDFAAIETPVVLPPVPASTLDTDTGDAPDQSAIDMAALLPLSEAAPVRINPSQIPDLITLPTLGQADEAPIAGPLSIDQVLPEVAPDLAAAPALDTVPVAETEPAIFTESFTAAGEAFLPLPFAGLAVPGNIDGLIMASVDRAIILGDAAGPPAAPARPSLPLTQIDPPPAEQASDTDAALGLVTATVDGTVAPGGYTVILGRPVLLPLPRPSPTDLEQAPETDTADVVEEPLPTTPDVEEATERTAAEIEAEAVLRRIRPIQRPEDRAAEIEEPEESEPEIAEEPVLDSALIALSRLRPTERPASIVRTAAVATAAAEAAVAAAAAEEANAAVLAAQQAAAASLASTQEETESGPVSELALAASGRPRTRPRSVERDAARIVTQRREQAASAVASAPAQPSTPAARTVDSGAQTTRSAGGSVARAATETNVLRLNQVNLIGVYGKAGARRALVRLANGRYVKVEVGDRLDRGRVTAIGESELSYQRGGRNQVLRMPRA